MKRVLKITSRVVCILMGAIMLFLVAIFTRQAFVDKRINNDYSEVYEKEKYVNAVQVEGIELVEQEISCGYATIEMLSGLLDTPISEEELYALNDNTISTALGNGFQDEMNAQFTNNITTRCSNLTNLQLIDMVYDKLEQGIPVPIEFAALYETEEESVWTLHFALVTAMDVKNDLVTIYNPYGYIETYSISEFLEATRYDAYEDMEYYFRIAFAMGIFDKNTVYMID